MVAPVPIPDLTLQASAGRDNKLLDLGAQSRAGSSGSIGDIITGSFTADNNWLLWGLLGSVTIVGLIVVKVIK